MYIMLTREQAEKFAIDYQTSTDNILKEHYQLYLLDLLYSSSIANNLIFKGGTAIKLVYNSFRFSEDLDFSLVVQTDYEKFKKIILRVKKILPESVIKEIYNKKNTFFAKINFQIDFKPIPIGIKIEINKEIKKGETAIKLIKSPFNNIEAIGNVFTLREILKKKLALLDLRREPRDLFDAWYLKEKIGEKLEIKDKHRYSHIELMNGLNSFLPINKRQVIKLFEK